MSDDIVIDVKITNLEAFRQTCASLDFVQSFSTTPETITLFEGNAHHGIHVRFKNWSYPVVFSEGRAVYDNYNGKWGDQKKLDTFLREYTANAAIMAAKVDGCRVTSDQVVNEVRVITLVNPKGKQIKLECTKDGAHAEVIGCTGKECEGTLNSIKKLGNVTKQKYKPEYFKQKDKERLRERE